VDENLETCCFSVNNMLHYVLPYFAGPSWSYGSWIYNYLCNQCLSLLTLWVGIPIMWGVLDTTLCDKVCQLLATGRWFSPVTPVFSTNETDRHDRTEILLKVSLYTIALTLFRCILLLSLVHLHFIMVHFRNCSKLFYPIF